METQQEKKILLTLYEMFLFTSNFLKCIKLHELPSYCCRQKDRQAEGWKGGQCQNYIPLPLTREEMRWDNKNTSFKLFSEIERFLCEIETDSFTVSNNEIITFGFSLFGTTFFLPIEFPMNFGSKTSPKDLRRNTLVLSEIM